MCLEWWLQADVVIHRNLCNELEKTPQQIGVSFNSQEEINFKALVQ